MAVLSAAWSKKNLVNDKAGAIAGFFIWVLWVNVVRGDQIRVLILLTNGSALNIVPQFSSQVQR